MLTPEEKELGVAVVEIGAGTTGVLVFADGAVKHTAVLSVGGNHVSSDIAAGLRTPFREAELLKRRYGARAGDGGAAGARWSRCRRVGGRAPRELSRRILAEIIEPRLEEIFALVQRQLIRCGLDSALASGIVLTGGSVMMDGVGGARRARLPACRCASARRSAARASTRRWPGPAYAAAVGLIALRRRAARPPAGAGRGWRICSTGCGRRMVGWLKELM